MRISTMMQHKKSLKTTNSENYKKFFNTTEQNKKPTSPTTNGDQIVKIGDKILVEKKGDQITISQVGKDQQKSTLQELSAKSEEGKKMMELLNLKGTVTDPYKNKVRAIQNSASLSNYL